MMKQLVFLSLLVCVFIGCSKHQPVKGRVTFSDDGSPLTVGEIQFDDGQRMARATLEPDGTFIVGFEKKHNGIPPGNYRIAISGAVKKLDNPQQVYPPPMEMLIDSKYADFKTSGLTLIVDETTKEYNITVDRLNPGK